MREETGEEWKETKSKEGNKRDEDEKEEIATGP